MGQGGRAPSFSTSLNHCLGALLLLGICHVPQVGWEGKWLRTTGSLTIFDKQAKPYTVHCKILFKYLFSIMKATYNLDGECVLH